MRALKIMALLLKTSSYFNVQEEFQVHFLAFPPRLYLENEDKMAFSQHIENYV